MASAKAAGLIAGREVDRWEKRNLRAPAIGIFLNEAVFEREAVSP
ncbi:MAG: hypothetical protein WBX25_32410 [Rhodomicrobium sp.]